MMFTRKFFLLTALLMGSAPSLAHDEEFYELHYGDRVVVHSRAWKKLCYSDEFVDPCGKIGVVIAVRSDDKLCGDDHLYEVRFNFPGLDPEVRSYCAVHLKKVGPPK